MQIAYGSYAGDNQASRSITSCPFAPRMVWIRARVQSGIWYWKGSHHAVNEYNNLFGVGSLFTSATGMKTLDANGFSVGVGLNATGTTYDWNAFEGDDSVLRTGKYTGTGGSANITIATGWVPAFMRLNSNQGGTYSACYWHNPPGGNLSHFYPFLVVGASGYITGTHADGFSVASAMNTNALRHDWFAFKVAGGNVHVGQYTGNDSAHRNIVMGDTFQPAWMFNCGRATSNNQARNPSWRDGQHTGDQTYNCYWGVAVADLIEQFNADGMMVDGGTINYDINDTGYTYVYVAFKSKLAGEIFDRAVAVQARGSRNLDKLVAAVARLYKEVDHNIPVAATVDQSVRAAFALPVLAKASINFDKIIPVAAKPYIFASTFDRNLPVQARASLSFDRSIPVQARSASDWTKDSLLADSWVKETAGTDIWVKESALTDSWGKV